MRSLLEKAWAQVTLAIIVGLGLTFLPPAGWTAPLHHIGVGLLVAAIVTGFWHLREFSEFFEKFASTVLIEDKYLKKLKLESLTALRSRVAHVILESRTNNKNYRHHELGEWLDGMLFDALLPGKIPRSGVYRENYRETTVLEYLTLEDALREVGGDDKQVPADQLKAKVLKVTSISRYKLIAPKVDSKDYAEYPIPFGGNGAGLSGFPLEKRISLEVGHDERNSKPRPIEFVNEPKGGISYKAEPMLLAFKDGECDVWTRTIEYQSPARQSHILNMMAMLTCGLEVDLRQRGAEPKLIFEGDVIATGNADEKNYITGGVALTYEGWLFEGHGYYLWWWEADA